MTRSCGAQSLTSGRLWDSLSWNKLGFTGSCHTGNAAMGVGCPCRYPLRGRVRVWTALKLDFVLNPPTLARYVLIEIIGLKGVRWMVVLHARLVLWWYCDLPNVTDATPGPHTTPIVPVKWRLGTWPDGILLPTIDKNHWSCDWTFSFSSDYC